MPFNISKKLRHVLGFIARSCLYAFLPAQRSLALQIPGKNMPQLQLEIEWMKTTLHMCRWQIHTLYTHSIRKNLLTHPGWQGFWMGMGSFGAGILLMQIR